jgi:glycerophosphoryl diester phosphodiesterase
MQLLRGTGGVLRIGHRGAAALAPENSLEAIEAAAQHGVDIVELDVVRGVDGVVLGHGPELGTGAATLDDALRRAAVLGLSVQIDVKQRGVEADVVAALRRHDLLGRSFVSACPPPILAVFAALEPALPRSLSYPDDRFGVSGRRLVRPAVRPGLAAMRSLLPRRLPRWLRRTGASAVTLNWAVVTPAAIDVCHRLGAGVFAWTVNEPGLAKTLAESGVDGIITDDPRIFVGGTDTS